MSLDRLKWYTIVLPVAFLVAVNLCTVLALEPMFGGMYGHWIGVALTGGAAVLFSTTVFMVLGAMQAENVRRNDELAALNAVGRAVSGSLDLHEAISRALGNVMRVTRARAGEIVVDGATPEDKPLRLSTGPDADLQRLARLARQPAEEPQADGSAVRVLRLPPGAAGTAEDAVMVYASVPLIAKDRRLGVMRLVADDTSHLAGDGNHDLLAGMGSQIAVAIQSSHLFEDVRQRAKEAQILYEIGLKIAAMQDIREILQSIVEQARAILGSDTAALCMAQANGDALTLACCIGSDEAFRRAPAQMPPWPLALTPAAVPAPAAVDAPRENAGCAALTGAYRACSLAAPLLVGTARIGELCVSSRAPRHWSDRHREMLARLADMAAIAVNNARLLESERYVAVLEERDRLAREMHDSLAQVLGYLHLKAQVTKRTLAQHDVRRATDELDDMAALAHEAYVDVRETILGLRETVSPAIGIVGTLREYLQKFSRQAGIRAELDLQGETALCFPPEVEVQLVRVVQEALTNVRKHAVAERAWIRIARQGDRVRVSIEDNGCGFDPAALSAGAPTFGLRTMRERVERAGGSFAIESRPGSGTSVIIEFALVEADDGEGDQHRAGGRPVAVPEGPARTSGTAVRYAGGRRGL